MPPIYEPAEDSFLFVDVLKKQIKNKNLKILEIGSGSGILAKTLIELGIPEKNLTITDVNSKAINHLKKSFPNSSVLKSNLFVNINGKFDMIIFNPPYLPKDQREPKSSRLATTGGKTGSVIINRFLVQARKFLKTSGKIFLLTSSLTKDINWKNYRKKLLAKKKLFFEELYVYELCK